MFRLPCLPYTLKDTEKLELLNTGENFQNAFTDNIFLFELVNFFRRFVEILENKIIAIIHCFINSNAATNFFKKKPEPLFAYFQFFSGNFVSGLGFFQFSDSPAQHL